MENTLVEVAKYVLTKPKVKGYMAIDAKGLCLLTDGISENLSGFMSEIAEAAKQLDTTDDEPIIELETEKSKYLIKTSGHVTTVVHKAK